MKTYQRLIEIQTFQNNIGLNLYVVFLISYMVTILKKRSWKEELEVIRSEVSVLPLTSEFGVNLS